MTAKATPPIAVMTADLAGIAVDSWIKWITLAYVIVMLGHKCWTWYVQWQDRRKGKCIQPEE